MSSTVQRRAVLLVAGVAAVAGSASADAASDFQKIMDNYAAALASGDVEALVGLYSPKGVFMREEMKAVVGQDALRAAYKEVRHAQMNLHYRAASGGGSDMAWLRSVSRAQVKLLKTGVETKRGYNQLVVSARKAARGRSRLSLRLNRPEPGRTPT